MCLLWEYPLVLKPLRRAYSIMSPLNRKSYGQLGETFHLTQIVFLLLALGALLCFLHQPWHSKVRSLVRHSNHCYQRLRTTLRACATHRSSPHQQPHHPQLPFCFWLESLYSHRHYGLSVPGGATPVKHDVKKTYSDVGGLESSAFGAFGASGSACA